MIMIKKRRTRGPGEDCSSRRILLRNTAEGFGLKAKKAKAAHSVSLCLFRVMLKNVIINYFKNMSAKKKILVIEDEKTLSDAIIKKLKVEGYEVDSAYDGSEGLEKMRMFKPDLVLLDILMPKVDGFQVMETVHKNAELSKIPIIIISNSGQPVEIERAIKLGVKDYLVKAEFDPGEVIDKVKNIIGGPEQANGAACARGKKNILIMEDDQLLRSLCSRKFVDDGFHVETAVDAEDE